jgi:hypothetical protein
VPLVHLRGRDCGGSSAYAGAHHRAVAHLPSRATAPSMYFMDDVKKQLPFPYNQDLSPLLRRLDRVTEASRRKLANDPVTAAYLAAGLRLLKRHLGPGRPSVSPDDEDSAERPLLRVLSQRAVADEVANNDEGFARMGSVSTLRSTWKSQSDFIADLLRFGLWSAHYLGRDVAELADQEEQLTNGPDLVEDLQEVCYRSLKARIERPMFRLHLLAAAAADGDEVIRDAIGDMYQEAVGNWRPIYEQIIQKRGLQLRTGVTIDDMVYMTSACAERLALRAIADPNARVLDDDHRTSLLGKFALTFFVGCTEVVDQTDGKTLDQVLRHMVDRSSTASVGAFENRSQAVDAAD